jgi:hypothetical protein
LISAGTARFQGSAIGGFLGAIMKGGGENEVVKFYD